MREDVLMLRLEDEKDPEVLRQAARILEAENKRLIERNLALTRALLKAQGADASTLQLRIAELEQQLARSRQMLFGTSSEKREPSKSKSERDGPPQTGHGPTEQKQLSVIEELHLLDDADQQCPKCGKPLSEIKGQFEESEMVEVVERQFVLKKHKRQKYRCTCNECIETALGPTKLPGVDRYSIDFAIEVAIQKYVDHLPLERQVKIMKREGLVVTSQTLWDCIEALAKVLGSTYEALHRFMVKLALLHADETRWPLLGSPDSTKWHAWALASPEAAYYQIEDSRSAEAGARVLGEFQGKLVVDGYSVYPSLAKRSGNITLVHCWAHVRREFLACEQSFPQATAALEFIGELFGIEKLAPTGPPGNDLRLKLRRERSRTVIDKLRDWAFEQRTKVLPQSGLAKAIEYMLGLWSGLTRFLDDASIPLDNNLVERGLRGPVIGRKNHYGSRSRRGTEVAALFYSLLESAKLNGLDPKVYLCRAFDAALCGEPPQLPHELAAIASAPAQPSPTAALRAAAYSPAPVD